MPISGADSMDLRIWSEADVLVVLRGRYEAAPRLVSVSREPAYQVHEWVDRPVARRRRETVQRNVWTGLGIPEDPFALLDLDMLIPRPSVLVHSDVHRKNLIVQGDGRLVILDWELALAGDPVYELAVHLHKTGYTPEDEERVRRAWVQAWEERGGAPPNWEPDVSRYLAHERIKSAVVDSVRYSKDLGAGRRAAGNQDPPSSATSDSLGDRALEAARNYAPKLARARAVWGDRRPVERDAVAAALMAASSG